MMTSFLQAITHLSGTSVVILTTSAAPIVDCTSQTSIQNGVQQCFTDNGFQRNVPMGISTATMSSVMQTDAPLENLTVVCMPDALPKYKSSLKCAINVLRVCFRQDGSILELFLPSPSQIDEAQDYLCANKENFDAKCVTSPNVGREITACSVDRARGLIRPGMSAIETGCLAVRFVVPCTREKTAKCGIDTSEVFTEIARIQLPGVCGGANRFQLASHLLLLIFLVQCISNRF